MFYLKNNYKNNQKMVDEIGDTPYHSHLFKGG